MRFMVEEGRQKKGSIQYLIQNKQTSKKMTQTMKIVIAFGCLSLAAIFLPNTANACNARNMGGDTPVCVCSASQRCDGELSAANNIAKTAGEVTSFVTAKSGARFNRHTHRFAKNHDSHTREYEIEIRDNERHQTILGFGGAFTDSTGYNIGRMARDLQGRLINDYFGPDGIEYRLARSTIGGSDFSTRAYSYDDHPRDESLSTFALQNEDYNYKMPFMRWAVEASAHRDDLKFLATAWSPPAWMKTNHELNHGGFLRDSAGGKYYEAYAKYMVRFLQEYRKNNVTIWGVTVVNEPGFGNDHGFRYNCLGFTPETQRDFIKKDLGPALRNAGFGNVAVLHYDHNIDHVQEYANTILGDSQTAQYVAGTAYHWYERYNKAYNRSILRNIAKRFPGKLLLNTEACLGYSRPTSLGDWHNFNEYADDIMGVLNNDVQGWIDWNMVLDMNGGPSWANTIVDAPIHVSDDAHEYYKLPLFYAMGHFSKFVTPHSVRLTAHETHGANTIQSVVFYRPDKSRVATLLNKNNRKVGVTVHDPKRGYLQFDMEPNSMQSLIWY